MLPIVTRVVKLHLDLTILRGLAVIYIYISAKPLPMLNFYMSTVPAIYELPLDQPVEQRNRTTGNKL